MLARLLPILTAIVLAGLAWYMYSTGTLTQMIRPTVEVPYAKSAIQEGQRVREGMIEMRLVPIDDLKPGSIAFETGAGAKTAAQTFSGQTASRKIEAGTALTSNMFGVAKVSYALRVVQPVKLGGALDDVVVSTVPIEGVPPSGAIMFETEEKARGYVEGNDTLSATRALDPGHILTVKDMSGAGSSVFILRAVRDFASRETLRTTGVEVDEVRSSDLPAGAIAFPSSEMATIFMTSIDRYSAARRINEADLITAELLGADESGNGRDIFQGLPQTLTELTSYENAYPHEVMRIQENRVLGDLPEPGENIDIWVETRRTDGAFGQIQLTRLVTDKETLAVHNGTPPASEIDANGEVVPASIEQEILSSTDVTVPDKTLWLPMKPETTKAFERIRGLGRVAFIARSKNQIVDILGNGAACLGDTCLIDRKASDDMSDVLAYLPADEKVAPGAAGAAQNHPLTMLDGVGPELAQRLVDNGYADFQAIADWNDVEITPITYRVDISANLALYIRQQARNIVEAPSKARSTLGIEVAPEE